MGQAVARGTPGLTKADQQERVFRLKLAGLSHDRIAAELGISHGTVANRLKAAIHDHVGPPADDYVAMREAELTDLYSRAYRVAVDNAVPADVRLRAMARCQGINESRRKLRGADAPVALEVSMDARADLTVNAITMVIDRLGLPPEKKIYALEAAAAALDGSDLPPVPEPEETVPTVVPGAPVIMSANGVRYVIVGGQRFEWAGTEPMPSPTIDAVVISDIEDVEVVDDPVTDEQEQPGTPAPAPAPEGAQGAAGPRVDADTEAMRTWPRALQARSGYRRVIG